jgi:hypothetical protein
MQRTMTLIAFSFCVLLAISSVCVGEVSTYKLNPQPEPPSPAASVKLNKSENPSTQKGINPQPEPPKTKKSAKPVVSQRTHLDPQPEPPAEMPKKPAVK